MEGDRRIILLEPGPTTQDDYGQVRPGPPIPHVVWATRRDRGGREGLQADTQVGEWQAVFKIRRAAGGDVNQKWSIEDERGRTWDIEFVSEVPRPPRRWLLLYAVARAGAV